MKALTLAAMVLLSAASVLVAESVISDVVEVPVDRLVANLEKLIAKDPRDPELQLNLARVHVMAYALKSSRIRVPKSEETRGPATEWMQENIQPRVTTTKDPARLKEANAHLAKAIARYENTTRLAPMNGPARLGYGWALQQSGRRDEAIAAYRETIKLSYPEDVKGGLMGHQRLPYRSIPSRRDRVLAGRRAVWRRAGAADVRRRLVSEWPFTTRRALRASP